MNTLFFKYAIEVEQTRSITKAAENLYMAQPNLSKAIRELEETLGFPIFVRSSKGVIPTDQGREFLKYAHSIMLELDKMSKISEMSDGAVQSFRISIPRGSYIAHGFTEFAAQLDPGKRVMLNVVETNSMQTIQHVLDGQSDLGIIRYQVAFEPYFMDYLRENSLPLSLSGNLPICCCCPRSILWRIVPRSVQRIWSITLKLYTGICKCPILQKPIAPGMGMAEIFTARSICMNEQTSLNC